MHREPAAPMVPGAGRLRVRAAGLVVLAALLLPLSLTVWGAAALRNRLRAEQQSDLDRAATAVQAIVRERIHGHIEVLQGGRALIAGASTFDAATWGRYAHALGVHSRPGLIAIGYVAKVPRGERAAFAQAAAAEQPGFAIWPAGERGDYFPVQYLEPAETNRPALGFDVGSEPARRRSAEDAALRNEPMMTAPLDLVQGGTGVLIFLPVYRAGASLDGEDRRRDAVRGWVYAAVRSSDLLRDLRTDTRGLELEISDTDAQERALLQDLDPPPRPDVRHALQSVRPLTLAGRTWALRFTRRPSADGTARNEPALVLLGGVVGSVLLCAVAWSLISTRRRAVVLAERMTSAMRRSEARMRALVNTVADGIVTVDARGVVLSCNAAAERMFGLTSADVVDRSVSLLLDVEPEDLRGGVRREAHGRHARGTRFPIELAVGEMQETAAPDGGLGAEEQGDVAPMGHAPDSPRREPPDERADRVAVLVVRDISARVEAENALRNSEERYRSVIAAMQEGVVVHDASGVLRAWNRAAERVLDLPADELARRNGRSPGLPALREDGSVMPAEDQPAAVTLATGRRCSNVLIGVRHNTGEVRWLDVSSEPLFRPGEDHAYAVVSTFTEVTERRAAERELRASEARTRSIIENMLAGLLTFDLGGRVESANATAAAMFGRTAGELAEAGLGTLIVGAVVGEGLAPRFLTAVGRVSEWSGRRRSGEEFPLELSVFEFQAHGERRLAASLRDLSERHEVERLKKEFVSTVSHELRTPLTSIRGSLGLLSAGGLGGLGLSAEARELIDIAERNSVRLISLINDILDLERLETGRLELRFEDIDSSALVDRALESVRGMASQQQIDLVSAGVGGRVRGDRERLVQVLVNLLSNAVKFSPARGSVMVSATQDMLGVEFRVRDHGRGIPRRLREAIFERFKQVEASDAREKGGTGLGLAICKAIIQQHGGEIGLDSDEGHGTTFWFRVPRSRSAPPPGHGGVEEMRAS